NYFPGKFANFIYAFHMPIFFILSGYLYHQQDSKKLMKKSFLNLIVPYIATVSLELCIIIFNRIVPNPVLAPSRAHSIKEFMVSIVYTAGAD
nr:acyltransferase family protein [Bifidobacterium bifidum]